MYLVVYEYQIEKDILIIVNIKLLSLIKLLKCNIFKNTEKRTVKFISGLMQPLLLTHNIFSLHHSKTSYFFGKTLKRYLELFGTFGVTQETTKLLTLQQVPLLHFRNALQVQVNFHDIS